MSEENKEKLNTDWSLKELSETEQNNILGFFALLLKVDKRVNPHLYAKEKYARHSNPNNP
ncbi:MAG: hypothetical protein ACKOW9_01705 [Candidatus Paceibacterota bacterium]